jgi:antitoxin component of MazEF toxin-antitoxin module
MKTVVLKVARIGNSRGIRLPAGMLRKYNITDTVVAEEMSNEIVLRAGRSKLQKLSWEETARAMSRSKENWAEWDALEGDGLHEL